MKVVVTKVCSLEFVRDFKTMNQNKLSDYLSERKSVQYMTLGWISSVYFKKKTAYLSLARSIVIGSSLQRANKLYSYVAKDEDNRNMIIIYLDGEPMTKKGSIEKLTYNSFMHVE